MKSKNWPNYVIAITVIVCSLILLAALTFALYGFQWKKGGRTLQIEFKDSTGIKLHSSVRYAGALAGTVTQIRYLTPEERKKSKHPKNAVRVTVRLNDDVPTLPADVIAGLASETILGEKFITLSPGNLDSPPLADGAIIQGQEVTAFDTLASSAQSAIENVNVILTRLNSDYPSLVPRLADLLSQGNSLLLQGSNFVHNADGAITNATEVVVKFRSDYAELVAKLNSLLSQGKSIATNTDLAVQQAGSFVNRADSLIKTNEDAFHQILVELRVVSQNLKVISTYTKALTGALGEKPSRLIWGGKKTRLPSEQEILQSAEPLPVELPKK